MTASEHLPPSYTTWTNAQLVTWAGGVGACFQPYLPALRAANVTGRWLSCLSDSDLESIGVKKIGDCRRIHAAVSQLIEDYAALETENLQSLLFSVVRVIGQFASLLKRVRFNDESDELEHQLVRCLLRLCYVVKKAASWLERAPFSHISRLAALRRSMVQNTVDLNTVLQSALRKSSLLTYVNAMSELTKGLKSRLEATIHDCDDSLFLTPCSVEQVSLRKGDNPSYGFTFHTNDCRVHIIDSLDSDLQTPALTCDRISRDDEIIEVNFQLVLGWEHTAVARLIEGSARRLDLRVRRRPSHCTDFYLGGSGSSRRQRMQAMARIPRPFTAEPQHSRRSDFLRNRTPKRRTQPLSNSPNTAAAATTTTTSHEEEKDDESVATDPSSSATTDRIESLTSASPGSLLKTPGSLSRSHSRPRHERYCQAVKISGDQSPSDYPSQQHPPSLTPSTLDDTNEPTSSQVRPSTGVDMETTPPRKNRRRPVTLGSLDDFSTSGPTGLSASSTPPSKIQRGSVVKPNSLQGWLWLKKRPSTSFGSRYVKRWCVFRHNTLYYYRSQEEENAEGLILLHGFTISPVATESSRSNRYPFRVYNEWTRFVFAADSEGARTQWMNMLGLAAIGQSACLWTSPIGGFHRGYLLTPSDAEAGEKTPGGGEAMSPGLLEPPRPKTSGGDGSARSQPVTMQRWSSSLNVPSSSSTDLRQCVSVTPAASASLTAQTPHTQPHHHFLSVSASCLAVTSSSTTTTNSTEDDEGLRAPDANAAAVAAEEGEGDVSQSPCRLTRRDAMIRRRRTRRLTEGSISPSVYLTSPPMMLRSQGDCSSGVGGFSLASVSSRRLCVMSTGTSSGGDEMEGGSLQLNPNRLSPSCSLSRRSSESPEQMSSS